MRADHHGTKRQVVWRSEAPDRHAMLFLATVACFALVALLLCIVLAASARVQAQPGTAVVALPQFVMDVSLPAQIVINADQGLGQCHWVDPGIIGRSYVSWAYDTSPSSSGWSTIEPQSGAYYWNAMDTEIGKARRLGKRIWVGVHVTEGLTPLWAKNAGVPVIGTNKVPVPWNETYQKLLRRVVHAMAARYDGSSVVDAIVIAAGGCYGEMTICSRSKDEAAWVAAGYTDDRFAEAVKKIIDIYLEEDYVWEDGSHSHGFLRTPVVLQIGTGLYGQGAAREPVIGYAMSKYGMRVWLKYNGLGDGNRNFVGLYSTYNTVTRVGYEPVGTSQDFLNRPDYYVDLALKDHSSYLCLQDSYFPVDTPVWQQAREMAARYLGAQIVYQGTEAPDAVRPGQTYPFVTRWVNRGTVPLMYGRRVGVKDVASSYEVVISFVRSSTGDVVFEHSFVPSVPTTQWYSAQSVRIEENIPIPGLPEGEYDLRVALVRPSASADDPRRSYRLVNTDLYDGGGRYTVGRVTVLTSSGTLPATRTPTPTATATQVSAASPTSAVTRTGTVVAPSTPTATRTRTTIPAGAEVTVVLQQGVSGYMGSEDTYMHQYEPDTNFCRVDAVRVGYKQRQAVMLRFDLSPIPAGANVTQAKFQVYANGWGGVDTTLAAYRLLRAVDMCKANWNRAAEGQSWGQPGCNDTATDRGATEESSVVTDTIWKWYTFDLTRLVQDWVGGRTPNYGVLLRGASPLATGIFYFASAEQATLASRPKLVVSYRMPDGPDATATSPATPTGTRSPTPSFTAVASASATQIGVPSATATPTPTATATATPTRTSLPSGVATTVILQQGTNGYAGSADTYIHQYEPDSNFCRLEAFRVGYKQRHAAILRFDLSSIPASATVSRATLQVYAKGWGGVDGTLEAFRLLRSVDLCKATWNRPAEGQSWGQAGGNDPVLDRRATAESSVKTDSIWEWYSFDLTPLVQDWVSGGLANHGLMLRGASSLSTAIFYFASVEDASPLYRPKLIVTYQGGSSPAATATASPTVTQTPTRTPTATPTLTGTPAATATLTLVGEATATSTSVPTATATRTRTRTPVPTVPGSGDQVIVTLQQGKDGYTGGEDTYFYQYEPAANYCRLEAFRVGYKQRYVALLRFDLSPIPAGAEVGAAFLQIYAKGWGGTDMEVSAYRLLRPVNMCQANWNQAAAGNPWGLPGGNDLVSDRGAVAESSVTTDTIWKWYTLNVTSLVQDWAEGRQANHGLLLGGASPLSTGMFYFCSTEDATPALRPKLVVTYSGGDVPAATRTATATLGGEATATATPVAQPALAAGPYLGETTQGSAVVSWATTYLATCELRYSSDASLASRVAANRHTAGGYHWYSALVSDLQTGTDYNYRVYCDGVDLTPWPQVSFRTAPASGDSQFRFAVVGDTRSNSSTAPPSSGARAIAVQVAQQGIRVAIHMGDIVYSGGDCADADNAWKQYVRDYFDLYKATIGRVPFYLSVGNHEVYDGLCGYQSYRDVYQLPSNAPEGAEEQYYSFDWGAAHFIALDSNQSLHRGSPQYMWLQEDLKNSTQEWKFVFLHHPVYSSGNYGSTPLLQEKLPPLFETYGVDAVFYGHDHNFERTCSILQGACVDPALGGVVYYVTGGGGAPLYASSSDWFTEYSVSRTHFLLVEMDGCRLRIDAVDGNGTIFDTLSLDHCS